MLENMNGAPTQPNGTHDSTADREERWGNYRTPELLRQLQTDQTSFLPFSSELMNVVRQVVLSVDAAEILDRKRRTICMDGPAIDLAIESLPSAVSDSRSLGEPLQQKSKGDYVTLFDIDLHTTLSAALQKIRNIPIVSEEGAQMPALHTLPESWLLDPLDGTTAYLCGELELCGPMIAYLQYGKPQFSVMLSLDGRHLAIAERGHGAVLLEQHEGYGAWSLERRMQSHALELKDCHVMLNPQSDSSKSDPLFQSLYEKLRSGNHAFAIESRLPHSMASLRLGSRRCAAVLHDNCAKFPKQMSWDVLPVKLWVEERGGVYWGIDGKPYDIDRPMPIVAATSPQVAEALIKLSR